MTARERAAHRLALERLRAQLIQAGPARIEPNRRDPVATGVPDEDAQALSEMLQVLASQRNKGQALMPYAHLCTECQAKQEPRKSATRRKVTDT